MLVVFSVFRFIISFFILVRLDRRISVVIVVLREVKSNFGRRRYRGIWLFSKSRRTLSLERDFWFLWLRLSVLSRLESILRFRRLFVFLEFSVGDRVFKRIFYFLILIMKEIALIISRIVGVFSRFTVWLIRRRFRLSSVVLCFGRRSIVLRVWVILIVFVMVYFFRIFLTDLLRLVAIIFGEFIFFRLLIVVRITLIGLVEL